MNVIEKLLKELERVIILRELYRALPKHAGTPAAALMTIDIEDAFKAIAEYDTVKMIVALQALEGWKE